MYLVSQLRTVWQLARPRTLLLIWLQGLLGYVYITNEVPELWKVFLALLASSLSYISAVAINDIADEEVDKLNLVHTGQTSDRPIINKTSSSRQVLVQAATSSVLAIICSGLITPWLGFVTIILVSLNIIYSLPPVQISKRGILAQLLLPIMYVAYPLLLALVLAERSIDWSFLMLAVGLYSLFVGRLFLKDIRDEAGDRKVGKLTYLVRHGHKSTLVQSVIWSGAGAVCTTFAVIFRNVHLVEVIVLTVAVVIGICFTVRACYSTTHLEEKLLFVAMMGRFASMFMFYVLVALILANTVIGTVEKSLLLLFVIALFGAGILMLYEELLSIRRIRLASL